MSVAHGTTPSRSLGRYELLFRIASGGMAEVFAARIRGVAGFEKLVAIKRMLPTLVDDEEFVHMFLDEGRVAAHISSPHVVATHELGRAEDGSLFIAMELVVGITLAQLLGHTVKLGELVPLEIALEIVEQAARGLHDAHEARTPAGEPLEIVHRDVSPHNVLVGVDGRIRITDFGVARAVLRLTRTSTGQMKGKYGYFSPEQIVGEHVDRRSDVFALGIVAWEALLGRRLFAAENPLATLERVRSLEIPAPHTLRAEVPEAVSAVVMAALARDASKRTATAGEFADALSEAAREARTTPRATRVSVPEYVRRAGGEPLARFQENIRRAMAREPMLDGTPGAVLVDEDAATEATSGVSGVVTTLAADRSGPGAAHRASEPPRASRMPSPRSSRRWRWAIVAGVVLAGAAGGLYFARPDRAPPAASAPVGPRAQGGPRAPGPVAATPLEPPQVAAPPPTATPGATTTSPTPSPASVVPVADVPSSDGQGRRGRGGRTVGTATAPMTTTRTTKATTKRVPGVQGLDAFDRQLQQTRPR